MIFYFILHILYEKFIKRKSELSLPFKVAIDFFELQKKTTTVIRDRLNTEITFFLKWPALEIFVPYI